MPADCMFCRIVARRVAAHVVLDEGPVVAFLDIRPLFRGHVLAVPRDHHLTLAELPVERVGPLMLAVQRLDRAVVAAMGADGTFVAMNNTVSQSVTHLHVHIVPRQRGDGLRGFFWPRQRYTDEADMAAVASSIRAAAAALEAGVAPGPFLGDHGE